MSKHNGCVIFLTGLPCSGKTTLARALYTYFMVEEKKTIHLDGDTFREQYSKDLGFSKKDRAENLKRVLLKAWLMEKNNTIVLCSFIAPYGIVRENMRKICDNFIEVFVDCPLDVCIERDVKGMYKKAIDGKIKNFTGINDPYEKPLNPEIVCNTDINDVQTCGYQILEYLEREGIL